MWLLKTGMGLRHDLSQLKYNSNSFNTLYNTYLSHTITTKSTNFMAEFLMSQTTHAYILLLDCRAEQMCSTE